jgi:sulfur-oxidizing protein SoxX
MRMGTLLIWTGAAGGVAAQADSIDGRAVFLDARKGNCASCHRIAADSSIAGASPLGPDLVGIKARYPDRAQLRAAVWDLSEKADNTIMPPYGRHRILTETEIDAVVRYLETL